MRIHHLADALSAILALIFSLGMGIAMPSAAAPQDEGDPIVIGQRYDLESKVLGETRSLLVALPDSYEKNEKTFPVLYLLDGPAHFHHTTGLIDFLSRNGVMPDMIVVAIANTARTRDLTPAEQDPEKESSYARTYRLLGRKYREKENNKLAIENYKRALELNPDDNTSKKALTELGVDVQ